MRLSEDEIYRTSTQYRLWSFTPEALTTLRANTNKAAADRVRAAVKRHREERKAAAGEKERTEHNGADNGTPTPAIAEKEVECLTIEEEQQILAYYYDACLKLGEAVGFPINVNATAVQYMKRFYLTNSPMTYQPKDIMRSALFLAAKTENHHTTAADFSSRLTKTSPEAVLAPEYLITQALRFTFDVRHPHRGLNGGHMELIALAHGKAAILPWTSKTPKALQDEMLRLPLRPGEAVTEPTSVRDLEERIGRATGAARNLLKKAAILTDAYFLYTPSQIWLSAYFIADEPITLLYLATKFPGGSADTATPTGVQLAKVLSTLRSSADLLASFAPPAVESREELRQIEKKLYHCRDPDKLDLIALNKGQKRDALMGAEGKLSESVAKRRKLEREKSLKEADAFWGPELKKPEPSQ